MTKEEFKESLLAQMPSYLRIDDDESEKPFLNVIAGAACNWITGSVCAKVPWEDERVLAIRLAVASDLYDKRYLQEQGSSYQSVAVSNTVKMLVNDFLLQLRLEGRT